MCAGTHLVATWAGQRTRALESKPANEMLTKHGIDSDSVCDVGRGTGRVLGDLATRLPAKTRLIGLRPRGRSLSTWHRPDGPRRKGSGQRTQQCQEPFGLILIMDICKHVAD